MEQITMGALKSPEQKALLWLPVAVVDLAKVEKITGKAQWIQSTMMRKPWAKFSCPRCKAVTNVPNGVMIEADGKIDRQIRCGIKGCGMKGYYKLKGWEHGDSIVLYLPSPTCRIERNE
jgi:hypothetical protein